MNRQQSERPHIEIYTDGGASPNPGPGGWGVVLVHPKKKRELSGGEEHTTNNRMELTAAIEALKVLEFSCVIDFYTDSEYLRKGITEWAPKWLAQGRLSEDSPNPVENIDLWRALLELVKNHEINWHWVKGHAGNEYNERAHQLASAAMPQRPQADITGHLRVVLAVSDVDGDFRYAAVAVDDEDETYYDGEFSQMTVNHGVLLAAIEVLQQLPPNRPIAFLTNNSYLVDGITKWITGWKKKGFKKFGDDWLRLDALNQSRQIEWVLFKKDDEPPEMKRLRALLRGDK